MSSYTTISPDKLARLIGTANMPVLIDVRTEADFAADPRLIPGTVRRSHEDAADWGAEFSGRNAIVSCLRGAKLAQGTAAWLRQFDVPAETLDGGFEAWKAAKLPLVPAERLPPRNAKGQTVWVTRARPKIDRIACPWLIRRFIDPERRDPVRRAVRSGRGRRALQRHARSTSRTCSGATAASSAPST